ncbi:STAS domain-containing protein [Fodinicola acaciae]|uniref:STAS domain-containing protein n=1 Tax=Fodinicola acaciae TaxID=2681555 RepID=UPI0013D64FED|nr:STAS domain-containing protein [Fodinicola acaciae]
MGRQERTIGNDRGRFQQAAQSDECVSINVRLAGLDAPSVVEVSGEVDMTTSPMVIATVNELLDDGASVIVDLSGVTFLGSSGLAGLVEVTDRASERDRQLAIVANKPPVVRPIEVTGLLSHLPTFASLNEALAQFA